MTNPTGRPKQTTPTLEEIAKGIFGEQDLKSIARWVQYWGESKKRNQNLIEPFRQLVLTDFQEKKVLDIGCGTGGLGKVLEDQCKLYVGGDFFSHVLQFAQSLERNAYVQCSGVDLPFRDQSFRYVFAFDVIEHLVGGKTWQSRFLKELERILQPLGMIFLTTPNRWHPFEGHTEMFFPHYLPDRLCDSYIGWKNPGFLREHKSFSSIQLLGPKSLGDCMSEADLVFLHDLPCGLDRKELLRQSPLRGLLAYLGLGWYFHAEFWGILVRRQERSALRKKLKKFWSDEQNQTTEDKISDFGQKIDFGQASFGHQLKSGWHLHEADRRGFRWIGKEAVCYLESSQSVKYLHIYGYSPSENLVDLWLDGVWVGEHEMEARKDFRLEYLIPFRKTCSRIFEVKIRCDQVLQPGSSPDIRVLGVMIFSLELV